jgi:hypothetical protein
MTPLAPVAHESSPDAPGHADLLLGYRRLAVRVIERALRDLDSPDQHLRQSAHAFLTGNPLLSLWCDLAGIGAARVIARAAERQAWPARAGDPVPQAGVPQAAKLATAKSSVS